MTDFPLQEQKQHIRRQLKQIRAAIPEAERQRASATITGSLLGLDAVQQAESVFIFISYGNEVHTHDLLSYFLDRGRQLAVPRILPDKTMAAVPFSAWEDLEPGELGILTPHASNQERTHFDLVITPGLGFTEAGYRIGYGRGYYDRWFAENSAGHKIAICYEDQIMEELPLEETDVPVDMIVTENRIINCT